MSVKAGRLSAREREAITSKFIITTAPLGNPDADGALVTQALLGGFAQKLPANYHCLPGSALGRNLVAHVQ